MTCLWEESLHRELSHPTSNSELVVKNTTYGRMKLLPMSVFKGMNKTCTACGGGLGEDDGQTTSLTSLMCVSRNYNKIILF